MARQHKSFSQKHSQKSHAKATGEVRIIGGDWRGRKLPVLSGEGLRPTSDRVRETLFNWLQFEIAGARVLDVFAGSGALGLEALSRGAASVTFCELNPQAATQLQQNLQTLKSDGAEVKQGDSLSILQTLEEPFDGVFLDPPFHQGLMQTVIDLLFEQKLLKNHQAWLYLEQEKGLPWPTLPEGWYCHREKTTSQVQYSLWHFSRDEG